jgi:hypothetical protein
MAASANFVLPFTNSGMGMFTTSSNLMSAYANSIHLHSACIYCIACSAYYAHTVALVMDFIDAIETLTDRYFQKYVFTLCLKCSNAYSQTHKMPSIFLDITTRKNLRCCQYLSISVRKLFEIPDKFKIEAFYIALYSAPARLSVKWASDLCSLERILKMQLFMANKLMLQLLR